MAVESIISLRIVDVKSRCVVYPTEILKILLAGGWRILSEDGTAFYKSPGDDEDADWIISKISLTELIKLFEEKEQKGELIGTVMTWQDTSIGGEVLLYREKEMLQNGIQTSMVFGLSCDRKIAANYSFTDVNWYLEKLLPMFNQGNTIVEYFTFKELI
jgi:hypothetical protein